MKTVCKFTDKATGLKFALVEPDMYDHDFDWGCANCCFKNGAYAPIITPEAMRRICHQIVGDVCIPHGRFVLTTK